MANGKSNPFDGIFRTLNWRAPSLTAATALDGTRLNAPFISNIAATTAIIGVVGAAANTALIQFIARDANGNIETQPVLVSISGATGVIDMAASSGAGGTVTTKITTALGQTATVTPNATTGLVSLIATAGTAQVKNVTIQTRGVIATGAVTIVA